MKMPSRLRLAVFSFAIIVLCLNQLYAQGRFGHVMNLFKGCSVFSSGARATNPLMLGSRGSSLFEGYGLGSRGMNYPKSILEFSEAPNHTNWGANHEAILRELSSSSSTFELSEKSARRFFVEPSPKSGIYLREYPNKVMLDEEPIPLTGGGGVTNPPSRNPGALVAFIVRCVVVVGLSIVAFNARRRSSSDAIEFSDRFRFFEEGAPIAFDWNQISGLWYEGLRNPARVNVLAASPNATEDRVLVVGISRGLEARIRVRPELQPRVLEWAQFVDRVQRSS